MSLYNVYVSAIILLSLPDIVFFKILVQPVEYGPLGSCPKRRNEKILWSVSCEPVNDNLRIKKREAAPQQTDIFLHIGNVEGVCFIKRSQVCPFENVEKLKFDSLYMGTVQISDRFKHLAFGLSRKEEDYMDNRLDPDPAEIFDRGVKYIQGISPADKAGMKAGDILCQVDDKPVDGESLETVVSWVKGEKGTEVTLYVERDGEQLELTAVRDTIEMQTVEYEMKEDQIGYIAVSEFDEVTYDQFKEALDDLENQGMEGLVIDLRNNPGGNLDTVTDMLRLLLPEGTIVSIKDKDGNSEELTCDGENEFTKPLAVLVNQYSASASEIFSAAIQDYGTGRIVGVTTYGKGVVQQLITLGDGTCLKLTIAEYFTPSGRSINGTGVEPDVEVQYVYDADNPEADNQLDAAISTVREEME